MGVTRTHARTAVGFPRQIVITAACALACAALLAVPATALSAPVIHVDLTSNMQAINGYGFTASATVTVSVFASPPPGGMQVWNGTANTEGSGAFSIPRQAAGYPPLSPGMHVRVRDDTSATVKDLTLAPLSFNALRWDTDVASGTASPGAPVEVFVSSPGQPTQDQLSVVAGPGGTWTAAFGVPHGAPLHTFDILYGMFANAHVQDGDQDATTMGSPPPPFVAGELDGRIWGGNWAHGSSVNVHVYAAGGAELYSGSAPTNETGSFVIEREVIGFAFSAGMRITVSDANYTKELTLADLTFLPLDISGDTASGTAPAGASVNVRVWTNDESTDLTVTANGSGAWVADFGATGFDIVRNTDGEARYWEPSAGGGDGDSTVVHPQPVPTIYAGQRSGIGGGGFAPDASVDVEVTDTDGVTTLFSDTAPTDANGGFDVQEGTLAFEFAPGMVVKVTGGTWTKELTLVPLTFDLIYPPTDTATGTGSAGEVVYVDIMGDPDGASKEVTVLGNGTWTVDFSPFDVTPAMNGGVAHFDTDGDSTRAEWYPPRISVLLSPQGWGDQLSGDSFTAGATVHAWLYASDAPGAELLWSDTPTTDEGGSFQVVLESLRPAPGMVLMVTDPYTHLERSLTVADLWVDLLDPVDDAVSGTAPAGEDVWVTLSDEQGNDLGQQMVTAGGAGTWAIDYGPVDLTWMTWGEVWVEDAEGDQTRTEAYPRTIECYLVGDRVRGVAFSRGGSLAVEVRSAADTLLWSGSVMTDARGLLSIPADTHGQDLSPGMRVRVTDAAVGVTKEVTLPPLTFDDLDAVTDTARGTGPWGFPLTVGGQGPGWAGEIGYPSADATNHWVLDIGAMGGDVRADMTADVAFFDDDRDRAVAVFVPHLDALSSPTHPDPDAWFASGAPSFAWTPSPGAIGYSWVLDQSAGTTPDQVIDGTATSAAFDGKADGVYYFHVRAVGGPGIYGGGSGYWGATSHLAVRIDSTPPAIATLASSTHGAGSIWSTNNDPVFEWTPGAGAGDIAGYSWIIDQAAATTPDETIDGTATRAGFTDVADGVWYLHVRARDAAGNWGAAQHAVVRIDAGRPTPRAYAASVRRGKTVSVGYRLDDRAGGCGSGTVKIAIKNARGKVVKTKTIGSLPVNVKKVWKFACRFPSGRYTISVTGSDLAGNAGTKVAKAVLRVR